MKSVCVDAGFLIALYDETDEYHSRAKDYFVQYFDIVQNQLLVPWPILYETISTRMARHQKRMGILKRDWETLDEQRRLVLLDDLPFRVKAIDECFQESTKDPRRYRDLSLVDRIIRNMLSEVNIKIDVFITFNHGDFMDVCKRFRRTIA